MESDELQFKIHKYSNSTESDFFNAVYPIISIVIRRTQNLQSRSGDGTCQATKDTLALLKKTFGVQSTQRIYGRKLDLMFIDRKHKAELCSSEWKKRDVSLETLLCQQTKNLRVSKCIFKKIVKLHISLPELQSLSIDIMDWRGALFSSLFSKLWGEKEVRILILGLDGAGKTTILYRLQIGEVVSTIPTIGFNVETVTYKNIKFQVWDLGGQTSIRPYWRCYYSNTDAVIYVVDSVDKDRMQTSREELHAMLEEEELKDAALLVFANKQDMEGALSAAEVADALGLSTLKNRQYSIYRTSALKGEGLTEGLDWLVNIIQENKK
ncbi:hypothetical protein [Parasitella parasitica]|uniref:ADP-ribosylation factor-like protein 1 n=1 Tax=Parasitella parasitica TaxID=35722 RepID=A0A0B7NTC6_9FUNG|nr:hypothetical protein [Parasitella parasitica]